MTLIKMVTFMLVNAEKYGGNLYSISSLIYLFVTQYQYPRLFIYLIIYLFSYKNIIIDNMTLLDHD
jgi:hypothetical protein